MAVPFSIQFCLDSWKSGSIGLAPQQNGGTLISKATKWGWGFSYNRLSYNGLSYNNLAILRQDSAITGLSYNKKGKSYNGKSYNGLSYNGLSYYNAWTVL